MKLTEQDIRRFWSKIDKSAGPTGCWIWQDTPDWSGYGLIKIDGKTRKATHIALLLAGKERPSSKHNGCHTCDVTLCVQPLHLFWGTQDQNVQDAIDKGRHISGQRVATAKLTDEKVANILHLIAEGYNNQQLARMFGTSDSAISDIRHNITWRHIPRPQEG